MEKKKKKERSGYTRENFQSGFVASKLPYARPL